MRVKWVSRLSLNEIKDRFLWRKSKKSRHLRVLTCGSEIIRWIIVGLRLERSVAVFGRRGLEAEEEVVRIVEMIVFDIFRLGLKGRF